MNVSILNSSVCCSISSIDRACVKNFILIVFVYQKLLHGEISKNGSKIKEFSLFPNFVVKLKAIELTYG